MTSVLLGPVDTFLESWHSVALWIQNDQMPLPWFMQMLAGGFAAGLIWISFNKALLNKLITIARIETVDSENSMLPTETKGTNRE